MTTAARPIGVDSGEQSTYVAHDRASGPLATRFSSDHPRKWVLTILNERSGRPAGERRE
jgi:hypothetical protein